MLCSASTLFYWFTETCVAILAEWSDLLACATTDYTARHGLKAAPKAANANNCEDLVGSCIRLLSNMSARPCDEFCEPWPGINAPHLSQTLIQLMLTTSWYLGVSENGGPQFRTVMIRAPAAPNMPQDRTNREKIC